jgi:hypothetical protein
MLCRRIQELENETKALRLQLLSVTPNNTASEEPIIASTASFQPSLLTPDSGIQFSTNALPQESTLGRLSRTKSDELTESRLIGGLEIGPSIINDCFHLYVTCNPT